MAKKQSPDTSQVTLSDTIKLLWAPVAGFAGAVILVMQTIQLWKGDQATATYVSAGLGALAILCGLVWVGFSKEIERQKIRPGHYQTQTNWRYPKLYRWARVGLALFLGVGLYGVSALANHRLILKEKTVPLIAIFDGPEETYGVTNELLERLNGAVADYQDIQVVPLGKKITVEQGSAYAQKIGKRYLADVVIWGWYRPTDNPNITLHIENLDTTEIVGLKGSAEMKPAATLADLSSFSVQQALGQEMSSLVIFISGYGYFRAGNYQEALVRFKTALSNKKWSDDLINRSKILFYISLCHFRLGQYDQGINDIDLLVQIDTSIPEAYQNRAVAYQAKRNYSLALSDFRRVLSLDPKNNSIYYNIGNLYAEQGKYGQAIEEFSYAIGRIQADEGVYIARGNAYLQIGEYEKALADYTQAIQIDPKNAQAYYHRGVALMQLGDKGKAIKDIQLSLELTSDPKLRATAEEMLQVLNQPGP